MLQRMPDTYMWVSPIPIDMIDSYGMCIRSCPLSTVVNLDFLIWRKEAIKDARLHDCARFLRQYTATLQISTAERLAEHTIIEKSDKKKEKEEITDVHNRD